MARIVDANVLVSAIVSPRGASAKAVALVLRRYDLAQTQQTIRELERVLARPNIASMAPARTRRSRLGRIRQAAVVFHVEPGLPQTHDPDDDTYLHLAIAADAIAIVTGDRDLLVLGEFAGIPILSPSRFLRSERSIRRGRKARGD